MADGGDPLLLTVPQAAELLGVSGDLVYDMVHRRELPAIRLGRLIRIPRHGLDLWIDQQAGLHRRTPAVVDFPAARASSREV